MKITDIAIFAGLAVGAFIVYKLVIEENRDPVPLDVENVSYEDAYQGRITVI